MYSLLHCILIVVRGFPAHAYVYLVIHMHHAALPLTTILQMGHYKTWTLDYGLDCGLDYGLDCELSKSMQQACSGDQPKAKVHDIV